MESRFASDSTTTDELHIPTATSLTMSDRCDMQLTPELPSSWIKSC